MHYIQLNYSKFFGGLFVDFSCDFDDFVVLELLDRPYSAVAVDSVNYKIVTLIGNIVSVVFQSTLDLFDDC